jgi:putative restriction endonuclease
MQFPLLVLDAFECTEYRIIPAMANAVFTYSPSSKYDDQPEIRYHFPRTNLRVAEEAVGDLILYYEPRRTAGTSSSSGRQAYFAMAQVVRIVPDDRQPDHFYAYVVDYLEFDSPVPFRQGGKYFESILMKEDGSTSKGAFGRNMRNIPRQEFDYIVAQGFARELQPWEVADRARDPVPDIAEKPLVAQVINRRFRGEAFRRHVREAYGNTCAVTGLCLLNGGGRPEVQAAHIRSVEANGPDTVRNGLALTATVHWMFDRGLISVDESLRLLVAKRGIPQELAPLVQPGKLIRVPVRGDLLPHATYLRWHREERFKG